MVFFEAYLLCSYNAQIGSRLLVDCKTGCYDDYRADVFVERVVERRKSYLACIAYEAHARKRVSHKAVPVMLGSYIDYRLRGKEAVETCRAQWGAVILKGMLKIYTSFSTFDALSMHVRQTGKRKSIEWYTYVDGEGMALCYADKTVTCTYRNRTHDDRSSSGEWIDLVNRANPFVSDRVIRPDEYTEMFDTILGYPYDMNDLKNRQFLSGVTIVNKYIDRDLAKRRRTKGGSCVKMGTAFETGSLYTVLSKKNMYETEEWWKTYPQNYDNTLHEGRSNKTAHFLPNVTRASNEAFRNSKALDFPTDAVGYFCILNTKELKSAGEQNVLADFVIMTEESDPTRAFLHLSSTYGGVRASSSHDADRFVINGFLTDLRCDRWTFEEFLHAKRQLPHVTVKYYRPYVVLSTKASIPVKYSDVYDVYFSPAETAEYGDRVRFPEGSLLSVTAKTLDADGLRKTPPAKSTVAVNNVKGSVAVVTSEFHRSLMRQSLGTTCYMDRHADLTEAAVLSRGNPAPARHRDRPRAEPVPMPDTDVGKAMQSLLRLYNYGDPLLNEYNGKLWWRNTRSRPLVKDYLQTVLGERNYRCPDAWNLRLWAVFGNRHGACVEDGVVLDRASAALMPDVCYNACITVDFTFKTVRQPDGASFVTVNETATSGETLVGCLITETEVTVKNSRHCNVTVTRIGNHHYYLLHFLPKRNGTYEELTVREVREGRKITVVINGVHRASVGVGTKMANAFGQKNICSLLDDLTDCRGITADGREVHAQIMYSDVSIVGRVASGQLHCMLNSPDLALGARGEIIAPVDLVVHSLHPYTNVRVFDVKVDTLTNVNGFDSQALANVSLALRKERRVLPKALQAVGLHGYDVRLVE